MRAVELFKEHDACQLVGQRQLPEREAMIDVLEFEPKRPADHEAEVPPALPALLEKPAEGHRIELLSGAVEQRYEGPVGQAPSHVLVLPDLDNLDSGMARQQLVVMLVIVGEGLPQPTHGDDDDPHG